MTQARARLRLLAALSNQFKGPPPQLRNGDRFLYWKTEVNKANSRWAGPAVCLCQNRSLVLGLEGGHYFVVHSTRVRFHYRSELLQLQPPAHMPEQPAISPTNEADRCLLSAIDKDEANLYEISIGEPWDEMLQEELNTIPDENRSYPSSVKFPERKHSVRFELDSYDDKTNMPGEQDIILRDDKSLTIIEKDQGTGTHPLLMENTCQGGTKRRVFSNGGCVSYF